MGANQCWRLGSWPDSISVWNGPTSKSHFVFQQRLQLERECPRQRHQSRCSLESQFQSRLSSAHMESRSLMVVPSELPPRLPFIFVSIRPYPPRFFLRDSAPTSDSQRSLRLNRSDFQCRSKRPRNQFLQVLETTLATCYSVGLLTIMRYNTSYGVHR